MREKREGGMVPAGLYTVTCRSAACRARYSQSVKADQNQARICGVCGAAAHFYTDGIAAWFEDVCEICETNAAEGFVAIGGGGSTRICRPCANAPESDAADIALWDDEFPPAPPEPIFAECRYCGTTFEHEPGRLERDCGSCPLNEDDARHYSNAARRATEGA